MSTSYIVPVTTVILNSEIYRRRAVIPSLEFYRRRVVLWS